MLSPAQSESSSDHSSSTGREHNILEPISVSDFMVNLRRALDHQFYMEDPGRDIVFNLVGDFVGPNNKRRTVFYVAHGPVATAKRLTRMEYTMPVGPIPATLMFGGDGETTLPAVGPDFATIDVPDGSTAVATVAAEIAATLGGPVAERLASWDAELVRVATIRDNPAEQAVRRQGASNIIRFWEDMRPQIHAALFVHVQRVDAAPLASPMASPLASPLASEVQALVSSSENRRRRNTLNRNRNRNHNRTRRVTGDPNNGLGYERNAVTGKLTRRRRPNSDPK